MRNVKILLLVLVSALFMASCSHKIKPEIEEGMGEVVFDISTALTKVEAEDADINVDDFKIEILNSKGIIFKRWKTYAEYKENPHVIMNANGSEYTIRATYGDPYGVGFDAFYFKGETKFKVKPQDVTNVSVVCTMANVKVGVRLDSIIHADYSDVKVKVGNAYGSLLYSEVGSELSESGYLPAEPLTLNVEMVSRPSYADPGGKKYYFKKTDIEAAAGEYLVLTINTKSHPTEDVEIVVTIDNTTEDIEEEIDLPSYTLPFEEPEITVSGFDENGILSYVEGCTPEDATVHFFVEAKMKTCIMEIESAYLEALDFPTSIDFLNMDEATKNLLKNFKVAYPSDMTEYMVSSISLKELARVFEYNADASANTHTFTFNVTDSLDKPVSKVVRFIPSMADKSISAIPETEVWAHRANVTISTINGDMDNLYPEVSKDGGLTWQRSEYETVSIQDGLHKMVLTALDASVQYQVRATYNKYSSEPVAITTEADAQVPNSTMDEWTEGQVDSYFIGNSKQYTYYPWETEASRVWDTNNAITTQASGTPGYLEKKCFPMVTFVPGRDGKAAQIMAIAVNGGNTDGTSLSNAVQGELFIGRYGGSRETAFASRPDKMRFYYKYVVRTDDDHSNDTFSARVILYNGAEKIGEGLMEKTYANSVTDWTEAVVDINYDNNAGNKKATSIYIQFLQSTNTAPVYNMNVPITYGDGRSAKVHGGSILTVDDIRLIYE